MISGQPNSRRIEMPTEELEGLQKWKIWIHQDLRKFTVKPPFVGAIHESPLLYMVSMRKSCT